MRAQPALELLRDQRRVRAAVQPLRRRILGALEAPRSAAGVARELGLPRQRVNYHLRVLEAEHLVEPVGERQRRGLTERLYRTTAKAYVVTSEVMGPLAPDPGRVSDRFSAAYLVAAASRLIEDAGVLQEAAERAGKRLATLTLETEVRFATAERQHAFASELTDMVRELVARYHDDLSPTGRRFRFIVGGLPQRRRAALQQPEGES